MAKRLQQDSGEERVAAKSGPMMSLIARAPSNLSTSESPGKRSYGNQDPWSAKAEREDRTGQPVVGSDPRTVPDYYHEHILKALSQHATQNGMITKLGLLKSGKLTHRWVIERGNPLCSLKEKQDYSNLSLETMKQNQNCQGD